MVVGDYRVLGLVMSCRFDIYGVCFGERGVVGCSV